MSIPEEPRVTREDIKKGLWALGLRRGDNVGVHSSLSSFGYVAGGADAVIDAILETIGPGGTAVFPTYSNNKKRLALIRADIAAGIKGIDVFLPYDPRAASCWTGKIPDTAWRRRSAVRGSNPRHSLAAIGPGANEFTRSGNASRDGWDALRAADGYILLLGVTLGCCSAMHLAERYVRQLPESPKPPERLSKRMEKYEAEYGAGGIEIHVGYPGKLCYPDFARMEKPCLDRGIMKTGKIGRAGVKLLRLRELVVLYAEHLISDPGLFYHVEAG